MHVLFINKFFLKKLHVKFLINLMLFLFDPITHLSPKSQCHSLNGFHRDEFLLSEIGMNLIEYDFNVKTKLIILYQKQN